MRERAATRVIPKSAVTVAIETQGLPVAFGVVANISEAGACVWTNGAFQVGDSLVLRLSFPQEPLPLQAAGRVVWEEIGRLHRGGALRYGLQWSHASGPQHHRLKLLIATAAP
jgi:Tfp pilus assembly protein PilZ